VWRLREPAIFAPARALDLLRWKLRLPPKPPLHATPDRRIEPTGLTGRLIQRRARSSAD
jgi:hypothetical protein